MKKFYIYCITATLLFVACSNPSFPLFEETQSVSITIRTPTQLQELTHLVYLDENFSTQKINLSGSLKNENTIKIVLRKNQLTPILVYSGNADKQPYGCIYPLSTQVSEKSGFSASILFKIFVSSQKQSMQIYNLLSRFNWKRFDGYIQKRENPWLLDQQRICENIANGTFNVYSLKDK